MASNLPNSKDDNLTLPDPTSGSYTNAPSHAQLHANTNDAIKKLSDKIGYGASVPTTSGQFLGFNGSGTSWMVPSSTPTGVAGGDLAGSYPNPTVPGLLLKAPLDSPTFTGSVTVPTPASNNAAATKAYVDNALSGVSGKNIMTVYNVKDYGAKGDGTTDDLAAIMATVSACLAAGGGTIYSPPGKYVISNHIVINGSNFIFKGAGPDATTFFLQAGANSEVIVWGDAVTAFYNVKFCDFAMDGNRANQPASGPGTPGSERVGLRLRSDAQNCYYAVVENVHAKQTRHNGISVESTNYASVINCFSEYNDQFGIWWENGSNVTITNNFMQYNDFGGMKVLSAGNGSVAHNVSKGDYNLGIGFQQISGISIIGNTSYRAGWRGSNTQATTGMTVSLSDNVSFIGNSIFGAYGDGMQVNGTKNSSFIGNTFRRNGQQTDATYSDLVLTNAGGGSAVTSNVFVGNTFENDNPTYYSNRAAYNISAAQVNTHMGNIFRDNIFGTPVTGITNNLASTDGTLGAQDNLFGTNKGLNPDWFYSIGYLPSGTYTLDVKNGGFQVASGYQGVSTVALANGLFKGQRFIFKFNQDVGNKQITWTGSNIQWTGGFAPVFSGIPSSNDLITFIWDGGTWYGIHSAVKPHYKQYGYFAASQNIDPNVDGDVIFGTGYYSPTTLTISSGRNQGQQFTLIFSQDVGNKLITWPSNVVWPGGTAPTLSSAANTRDIIMFTWDGSNWNGLISSNPALLALKAPLASPAFTGSPTAPTASVGTNSTQLATTAFVASALANNYSFKNYGYLSTPQTITIADGTVLFGTGYSSNTTINVTAGTINGQQFTFIFAQDVGNKQITWSSNVRFAEGAAPIFGGTANSIDIINFTWDGTNWNGTWSPNQGLMAQKASTTSPTFTGTPTAPTAASTTNNSQIATTAFVQSLIGNLVNGAPAALDQLNEIAAAIGNDANFATDIMASIATKQYTLTPQTAQSANFTAVANSVYLTSGTITATLPASTANQWIVIKKNDPQGNTTTISYTLAGSATTLPLTTQNQAKIFYADGSGGWIAIAGDITLDQLRTIFGQLTAVNTWTAANTFNVSPVVPTPSTASQAANKSYVDNAVQTGSTNNVLPLIIAIG